MKILTKAALAATVATGLFASPALAANSATAPFTARATIMKPLTLASNNVDLDFGTITMLTGLVDSTVRVGRTGGAASACDTSVLVCSGTQTPAGFTATGVANQVLIVTVDTTVNKLTSGTNTVDFAADAPAQVTLSSTGSVDFDIGGTVRVLASTRDGAYSAVVPVTVTYQ